MQSVCTTFIVIGKHSEQLYWSMQLLRCLNFFASDCCEEVYLSRGWARVDRKSEGVSSASAIAFRRDHLVLVHCL